MPATDRAMLNNLSGIPGTLQASDLVRAGNVVGDDPMSHATSISMITRFVQPMRASAIPCASEYSSDLEGSFRTPPCPPDEYELFQSRAATREGDAP